MNTQDFAKLSFKEAAPIWLWGSGEVTAIQVGDVDLVDCTIMFDKLAQSPRQRHPEMAQPKCPKEGLPW